MNVSVVICTYNGAQFLTEQLQSIALQTQLPDEIIICDDGSTDETKAILEKFKQTQNDKVQLYYNEKRLGYIKNFEKAINLCSGDIVFLCDQDDIWLPEKIETVSKIFERKPTVTMVGHDMALISDEGKPLGTTIWESLSFQYFLDNFAKDKDDILHYFMVFGNTVSGASLAFRKPRQEVAFFTPYPRHWAHDFQLVISQFFNGGEFYFERKRLVEYRIHEAQQIGITYQKKDWRIERTRQYFGKENPKRNFLWLWRKITEYDAMVENPELKAFVVNFGKKKLRNEIADFLKKQSFFYRVLILAKWKAQGKYFLNLRDFYNLIFFG